MTIEFLPINQIPKALLQLNLLRKIHDHKHNQNFHLELNDIDGRFLVDSQTAIDVAEMLAKNEGVFAGVSSGATMSIALRIAEEMDKGIIVVMFSDGGWKYLPSRPWEEAVENVSDKNDLHWW